ncbi:RNA-directed DNA polymerase, eukaryota, reverse transcriptase zinc-binding domain protein [Tanacetum coccineum]
MKEDWGGGGGGGGWEGFNKEEVDSTAAIVGSPSGTLNALEAIRCNFFNGMERSEQKIAWISWDKILASKKYGGLGVSSFYALNRALLFKWVWLFFLKVHRYGLESSRLFMVLKIGDCFSWSLFERKVGDGESSLFWDDTWLGEATLKMQYPRLYALELYKDISVADKMRHPNLYLSFRRQPRGVAEQEQFRDLSSRITDVIIPQIKDRWVWSLDGSGEFSVKSVRNFIDDSILPKCDAPTRWVKLVPIKLNILAWRIHLDRLPTRMNLSSRGLEIPSILCPLCNEAAESTSHIFFSCSLARQILSKVSCWWELEDLSFNSYDEWLASLCNSRLSARMKEFFESTCYVAWWLIWRFRNQCLFGSCEPRRELLFDDIVQMSFLWISSHCKSKINWTTWMQNPMFLTL